MHLWKSYVFLLGVSMFQSFIFDPFVTGDLNSPKVTGSGPRKAKKRIKKRPPKMGGRVTKNSWPGREVWQESLKYRINVRMSPKILFIELSLELELSELTTDLKIQYWTYDVHIADHHKSIMIRKYSPETLDPRKPVSWPKESDSVVKPEIQNTHLIMNQN